MGRHASSVSRTRKMRILPLLQFWKGGSRKPPKFFAYPASGRGMGSGSARKRAAAGSGARANTPQKLSCFRLWKNEWWHKYAKNGIIVAMTAYQKIYDEAIGNYGLFLSSRAREIGISGSALVNLASRGRLERLAHGVYRIDKFVPHPDGLDAYACAVACCGEDAYLWESA